MIASYSYVVLSELKKDLRAEKKQSDNYALCIFASNFAKPVPMQGTDTSKKS